MPAPEQLICDIGRRAYQRELIDGIGGNISYRLPDDRILCTPTLCCKGLLNPEDLCTIDLTGQHLTGTRPPSSEIRLHLEIYAEDPAVRAVVHSHPPFATTLAAMGRALPRGVVGEAEILLGEVPLVPYQTTGTPAVGQATRPHVRGHVAALLQNHGAVTWGPELELAYVFTETLEAACRICWQAEAIGQLAPIPEAQRTDLAALRDQLRARWR